MRPVECLLCPRHCRLPEGGRGDCLVRTNVDGKLYSLVYAKPCSVHVDPVEKKPFFHVLPGSSAFSLATAGCNLHCLFCQNWQISQSPPEKTRNIDLPPQAVVDNALRHNCRSIAYTYSDPVVFYEYTLDTARLAQNAGLLNLLVTAAYIEQAPLTELCAVTRAANVDLKGITEDFYKKMCRASLRPVLDALVTMKKLGVWLEITNLVIPTCNDSDNDLRTLARWVKNNCGTDTPLHFSRFWPMHQLMHLPPTPEETLTRARQIAQTEGLHFVYTGNIAGHPGENTFCPVCKKELVQRKKYTLGENHLASGACAFCGQRIPGIW